MKNNQTKYALIEAVRQKHLSVMKSCEVNLDIYNNSVGIGEHGDLVSTAEDIIQKWVEAKEMVEACHELLEA
jgi:hypothetical protein